MRRFENNIKISLSILFSILYSLLSTFLIGCATLEYASLPPAPNALDMPGVYHRVEKGQTLWRISRLYDVDLDEIISANRISDAAQIHTGQLIFIPRRQRKAPSYAAASFQDFVWPVKGRIVSNFGDRTKNIINKGITLRPHQNHDVVASASGSVVFASESLKGYGKTVIIAHNDGIMTVYALLSRILVRPGDYLQQGTAIAKCENGVVHFQIRKGHIPQNPYYYLPG